MRRFPLHPSLLALAFVLAACGDGPDTSKKDQSAPVLTTQPSFPGRAAPQSSNPNSGDRIARALDQSLLTETEIAGLGSPDLLGSDTDGVRPLPQGPLSFDGIVAVLPPLPPLREALQNAKASFGANRTYLSPSSGDGVNILVVKFASEQTARPFLQLGTNVLKGSGAREAPHADTQLGVYPISVLRIPPNPTSIEGKEALVTGVLYENGIHYLLTVRARPFTVTDADVLRILSAQANKYQVTKGELGIG